jgi:hypothetical protein
VSGDITYTATYTNSTNKYTITWKNEDGSTLETDSVAYGTTPTYDGATPSKDGDTQYSYTFKGWDKTILIVTGDTTYTATYTSSTNKYTITWKNEDGTILKTDKDEYGSTPSYGDTSPSKDEDGTNLYSFTGWDKKISTVTGDTTYTAKYSSSAKLEFWYSEYLKGYIIAECNPASTCIDIPETYDDGTNGSKPVTCIDGYAFEGCNLLTSVVIPDSIEEIYFNAFDGCTSVTSLSIGKGVDCIDLFDYSGNPCGFFPDSPLTSITVSKDNTSFVSINNCLVYTGDKTLIRASATSTIPTDGSVETLWSLSFANYDTLKSIDIPDSILNIGSNVFKNCTNLASVTVGKGLCQTSSYSSFYRCFYNCPSLTSLTVSSDNTTFFSKGNCIVNKSSATLVCACESTSIPADSSVLIIGADAFSSCNHMTSLFIPANIIGTSNGFLSSCDALTSITVDSTNQTLSASGNCLILTGSKTIVAGCASSVIPSDSTLVNTIDQYAFMDTKGLKTISIPDNITSISSEAFYSCPDLEEIDIGSGANSIGAGFFDKCKAMKTITVSDSNSTFAMIDNSLVNTSTKTLMAGFTSSSIPTDADKVTTIGEKAFEYADFTELVIPANVAKVKAYGLAYCYKLASLTILGNTTFSNSAFNRDSELSEFNYGKDVTSIDTYILDYINPSVITIDKDNAAYSLVDSCLIDKVNKVLLKALDGATSIPSDSSLVTSIGEEAFYYNKSLKELDIPSNITSIESSAFEGCENLTSVTIPDSVTSIGDEAFLRCNNLTSASIGSGTTSVGLSIFEACPNLATLTVKEGNAILAASGNCLINTTTKTINCAGANPVIPTDGSVTIIGDRSFCFCKASSLSIPSTITVIGNNAFDCCDSLTSLIFPNSVTSIGLNAIISCTNLTTVIIPSSVTNMAGYVFEGTKNAKIYCEATSQPASWSTSWLSSSLKCYWYSETSNTDGSHWHYVDKVPTIWVA